MAGWVVSWTWLFLISGFGVPLDTTGCSLERVSSVLFDVMFAGLAPKSRLGLGLDWLLTLLRSAVCNPCLRFDGADIPNIDTEGLPSGIEEVAAAKGLLL